MTKFTIEQLFERARENVESLKFASTQHAFEKAFPTIEIDIRLAEIALAALTEQPVGFYRASRHGDGYYLSNNMEQTPGTIPLYRLPLLEGLK